MLGLGVGVARVSSTLRDLDLDLDFSTSEVYKYKDITSGLCALCVSKLQDNPHIRNGFHESADQLLVCSLRTIERRAGAGAARTACIEAKGVNNRGV